MNETKLTEFRTRLHDMADDLDRQDDRGQDSQKTVTLDQQSVGRLSRMDAIQQQAMAKATQARRNQMHMRIKSALSRIEDGEFGYCVQCGDDISAARLDLDPSIPICMSCAKA
ncbi:MAG: TraR/DksA C4-type zinc finger protein [Marinosulfonomonas sp.]|nr:TraR/DksA C4-type zinc finger protein [Marinosulfonomonas sp.]